MPKLNLDRLFDAAAGAGRLLILTHNNPDPDAIASAVALQHLLAQRACLESCIAYRGIIGRAENRALVRYLGHPLHPLAESGLQEFRSVAVIDAQPGAGNITLVPELELIAVVDHHAWQDASATAAFIDVRPNLGATATILTQYLQAAGLELERPLATALFYGIKTNTMGLARNTSQDDATAYFYLQPRIEAEALVEIEHAQVPADYFKSFDTTLQVARVYDGVLIAYIGLLNYPDLTAEMADILMRLEEAEWVICMGVFREVLFLSARTRSPVGGAEGLVQAMVQDDDTAGGQRTTAGGQVPLRGREPEQVAQQLQQRALRHLQVPMEAVGQPLV